MQHSVVVADLWFAQLNYVFDKKKHLVIITIIIIILLLF